MQPSKSLGEVARVLGKDPATIFRWYKKGIRGVRLQTFMLGGRRHVSDEALDQFFAAITAASALPGDSLTQPTTEPVGAVGIDSSAELARRGF